MALTRREWLKAAGLLGAAALLPKALRAQAPERIVAWRNWSGAQSCMPAARLAPATEEALVAVVRDAPSIRAVGSGHSFSALVPTDGTLVSLGNLSGIISHDADQLQAEIWGGTPMSQLGEPLKAIGQALPNMADIDYQTLAGAIATSTHGTGAKYGSYSSNVVGLRIVTANGDVLDCDANAHPDVFNAARVSLGALGVVTRIRLQNRKPFRLRRHEWVQETDALLEDLPRLVRENDHFELEAVLHSDIALASAMNETTDPTTLAKEAGGDGDKFDTLRDINTKWRGSPRVQALMLNVAGKHLMSFPDVRDDSYKVFANVRDVRFNEMEYSIPAEAGPACLREILNKVREENLDCFFPVEYRYVKADDIPLSMFQGRDSCSISVHQYYEMDYHAFFAQIEPIFWKYDGRPHWGKLHSLNARLLQPLYPRWKEFLEVREALDPQGKFLNAHLRSVFGLG
ncbi:FAD-binding protein [Dyella solisilvae]|uniref:FAD-binding protein n=1 Tax=Dyella solisilvae TaxID=1920168 RepID=A0A370K2C5_9GAMM|nr:D-arabinono-1,4-lactone oxidase [Dyella solisilvae]RDI96815.1 FAD-binding protein [Dyella solisilvae]